MIWLEEQTDEHGIPAWIAYDDERGTWLQAKERTNHAAAAVEQWRKQNPHPDAGARPMVVDTWKPSGPALPGPQPADGQPPRQPDQDPG